MNQLGNTDQIFSSIPAHIEDAPRSDVLLLEPTWADLKSIHDRLNALAIDGIFSVEEIDGMLVFKPNRPSDLVLISLKDINGKEVRLGYSNIHYIAYPLNQTPNDRIDICHNVSRAMILTKVSIAGFQRLQIG